MSRSTESVDPAAGGVQADRLFLGVPLTPHAQEALRPRVPETLPGSVVPTGNWHVTLRFLGETPRVRRDQLSAALRAAPLPEPFTIGFSRIGAFPVARRAKVLWIGIREGAQGLEALADVAERVAVSAGFQAASRGFHPHVTIARLKRPVDARLIVQEWPTPVMMPITGMALFRSRLGSGPAQYEILEQFLPLA